MPARVVGHSAGVAHDVGGRMLPQDTTPEEWRDVPGYEGVYSVSSLGRVRRERRGPHTRIGYILTPRLNRGYYRLTLTRDGQELRHFVHRLVAAAFIGPCPPGHTVNHRDGRKLNNRTDNLEYLTPAGQQAHASRLGLLAFGARNGNTTHPEQIPHGERSVRAKLTNAATISMRAARARGAPLQQLATEHHVSVSTVSRVCLGRTWRHT